MNMDREKTYRKTVVELVTTIVAEFRQEAEVLKQLLLNRLRSTRSSQDTFEDIPW